MSSESTGQSGQSGQSTQPAAPEQVQSGESGHSDPQDEVRLLRRQVQRERARRRAAENLGERATRDLYESVRQLRSAQSELLERADRSRIVNDLARSLRQ